MSFPFVGVSKRLPRRAVGCSLFVYCVGSAFLFSARFKTSACSDELMPRLNASLQKENRPETDIFFIAVERLSVAPCRRVCKRPVLPVLRLRSLPTLRKACAVQLLCALR